jgi:hypothetical protein
MSANLSMLFNEMSFDDFSLNTMECDAINNLDTLFVPTIPFQDIEYQNLLKLLFKQDNLYWQPFAYMMYKQWLTSVLKKNILNAADKDHLENMKTFLEYKGHLFEYPEFALSYIESGFFE